MLGLSHSSKGTTAELNADQELWGRFPHKGVNPHPYIITMTQFIPLCVSLSSWHSWKSILLDWEPTISSVWSFVHEATL